MLAVAHGPLRRSVDAARPFACGLAAMLAATTAAATAAPAADASVATAPRVPELVSPSDKGGNDVYGVNRATPDGNAIAYTSFGGFAGTPVNTLQTLYRSHRTATGWVTDASLSPINPSPAPFMNDATTAVDLNDDLTTAYYSVGGTKVDAQDLNDSSDVAEVTGSRTTWLSPAATLPDTTSRQDSFYEGRSADGSHVIIQSTKQLLPSVAGGVERVYDYTAGALKLVSVPPASGPAPASEAAQLGGAHNASFFARPADARAISTDGSHIYFRMDGQLYVRLNGTTTKLISASKVTGAAVSGANATFMGASDDGHVVTFGSDEPLVAGATTGGLYMYNEDDDSLRELAPIDVAGGDLLRGTLRTTADGKRVYFLTDAALTAGAPHGPHQVNLYVTGDLPTRLIATVGDGSDLAKLTGGGEWFNEAQVSGDGRRLAFPSWEWLTGPRAGTAGLYPQVYEYDLDADQLTCVSCPPGGGNPTGEASLMDSPAGQNVTPVAFANDGTLFFESPDRLTADDTDDKIDVYAHDADGNHLLSPNTPNYDVLITGNSADGRDVFIRTHETLTSDDRNGGYADVYDLRIGGGFPTTTPCAGEACRGPQSAPPATALPLASLSATDTSAATPFTTKATTFKVAAISAAARAAWARTGKVTLSVKVSDTAQVTAKATAKLKGAKKASTVASATRLRESAGTVKLVLSLSSGARAALKRSHKLTVKVAVTASGTSKAAHATVVLRTAAANKKAAKR